MTLDKKSWGFRRDIQAGDVLTLGELVATLARTISCNGNLLINIGPDANGRILPIFAERLEQFGEFVDKNSEAIFGTKPWIHQNDSTTIWYTSRVRSTEDLHPYRFYNPQSAANTIIYAFLLQIPKDNTVVLESVKPTDKVFLWKVFLN